MTQAAFFKSVSASLTHQKFLTQTICVGATVPFLNSFVRYRMFFLKPEVFGQLPPKAGFFDDRNVALSAN
jgi:hypothetical protein